VDRTQLRALSGRLLRGSIRAGGEDEQGEREKAPHQREGYCECGARDWNRTSTPVKEQAPETCASTNSATRARGWGILVASGGMSIACCKFHLQCFPPPAETNILTHRCQLLRTPW